MKKWEAKLKAAEDSCFWKNKYLDAKLARSGVFVPESHQHSQLGGGGGAFTLGNPPEQSTSSRLMLPVKGIQRDGAAVLHTAATVQDLSQSAARSELVQQPKQLRNFSAQVNRNAEEFIHSHDETILSLGKVGKRKQVTVTYGHSALSEEPSLRKRRTEYESPVNDTESSYRTMFAEPPILNKFATSGTVGLARFQNNSVKCAPNQVGKLIYECKPLPPSSVSDAVHPIVDVELEKAVLVKNVVDVSNISVPTRRLQESRKEEICPSILSVSIPSIAYVFPSVSIAEKPVGVSMNQSTDSNFSPVRSTSSCSTRYTVAVEAISDCESDGELIIDSSKSEDVEASQTEKKEDDSSSSSKLNNKNENSIDVENISPAAFDSSEKRSFCNNSGTSNNVTASQEKPIHVSPNPTDLKIFQEWLKGVTEHIVTDKSSKTAADDVFILSNSMKQVSRRDPEEDAKKIVGIDDQRLCCDEMGNLSV